MSESAEEMSNPGSLVLVLLFVKNAIIIVNVLLK